MNNPVANNRIEELKHTASKIFSAGINAVDPEACVKKHLAVDGASIKIDDSEIDLNRITNLYVVGFGKASAAMALPIEAMLGDRIEDGIIITKYGHGVSLQRCRVFEAGHPVPDENGQRATKALLDLVGSATPGDLILCLISGGGSALTPAPVEGIDLSDKQETTRLLLSCGATIHEINTVRKHLSLIKGGQLCRRANGALIVSLILSDVIGDDLDIIASGATAPDGGTFKECVDILSRYGLWAKIPNPVTIHLEKGQTGRIEETPKTGSPVFSRVANHIVGSLSEALNAAAAMARDVGYTPLILTSTIQGEAKEVAKVLASIAREVRQFGRPVSPPACLLSGGETTVTIKGNGKGGRNMELALGAAEELKGLFRTVMLSAGSDGTDGPTDAAGAFVHASTISRAEALHLSAHEHLAQNNAYPFFKALDDLLSTGPTRTNVMDLQIVLIDT